MRVVVTGSNGFIGKFTVHALLNAGYDVVAIDLSLSRLEEFKNHPKFSGIIDNINSETFKNHIQAGDKVLHLAAVTTFEQCDENPQRAVTINVVGTLNVVRACIEKQAERLVYSSSGAVYSPNVRTPIREDEPRHSLNVYGWTKRQAEDWILFYGKQDPSFSYIILRYGYIYGKEKDWGAIGKFITKIKAGEKPIIYGGEQINDFTHVDDIVQANLLALETKHLNQIYNIGTGVPTSIKDTCKICEEILGREDLGYEIKPSRPWDLSVFVYDINKAKIILGYNPKWKIREGIKQVVI